MAGDANERDWQGQRIQDGGVGVLWRPGGSSSVVARRSRAFARKMRFPPDWRDTGDRVQDEHQRSASVHAVGGAVLVGKGAGRPLRFCMAARGGIGAQRQESSEIAGRSGMLRTLWTWSKRAAALSAGGFASSGR